MSEKAKINENANGASSSTSVDDALAKLEDHRCAICQNIIINACRIGCGHTYCRHCLNIDRENRNRGGKSTCFICDAAVTEITHNKERDKEIDDIYATLPINERLSRARAKAERKEAEETRFLRRPQETNSEQPGNNRRSIESIGGGDGDSSSISGMSRQITDSTCTCRGRNCAYCNYENESSPSIFYRGGYFHIQDGSANDSQTEELHEDDNREEGRYNESVDELNSPPVILHHSIQHVHHTIHVRNSLESTSEPREITYSDRQRLSQQSMNWSHARRSRLSGIVTDHNQLRARRLPCNSPNRCNSHHVPSPLFQIPSSAHTSAQRFCLHPQSQAMEIGTHLHYYGYQQPFQNNVMYNYYNTVVPCPVVGSYGTGRDNVMTNSQSHANYSYPCHQENERFYNQQRDNRNRTSMNANNNTLDEDTEAMYLSNQLVLGDDENYAFEEDNENESDSFESPRLCPFHRLVQEHGIDRDQSRSNESISSLGSMGRTRSFEMVSVSPVTSESREHFVGAQHDEQTEDSDDSENEDHIITFSVSIPIRHRQSQTVIDDLNVPSSSIA